jgi:hypothetical protein
MHSAKVHRAKLQREKKLKYRSEGFQSAKV